MKKYLALVCSIVVIFAVAGCGNNSLIEESAVPIVTQICKDYNGDIECVSVKITEKVSEGFYKAKATLNNANKIDITIRVKGDNIEVMVLDN